MWQSRCPGLKSRSHYLDQPASSGKLAGYPPCLLVRFRDSGSPLSGKQMVIQVQLGACAVRHGSPKDLWVHSTDLESILLPLRVDCIDGVLQVTVLGVVTARQCLPTSVCHYLSTSHTRGGKSMLADHLMLVKELQGAAKRHVPWPRNTLDLVL
jgi:hypothetical protein